MEPTIRGVLKRRMRRISLVAVAGWVLAGLSVDPRRGQDPAPLVIVGFLLVGGALFAMQRAIRCPKCSVALGQKPLSIAFRLWSHSVNSCPHCGVSLDEPLPQKMIE